MDCIIFGLISFIIQIYVLKHTYSYRVKGDTPLDWTEAEKNRYSFMGSTYYAYY